jgi:hypothetical protein
MNGCCLDRKMLAVWVTCAGAVNGITPLSINLLKAIRPDSHRTRIDHVDQVGSLYLGGRHRCDGLLGRGNLA